MLLQGSMFEPTQPVLNCPLHLLDARVQSRRGDSLWVDQVRPRQITAGAPAGCATVTQGVLVLREAPGLRVARSEYDGATTLGVAVVIVALWMIIATHGATNEIRRLPKAS